MIDSYEFLKSVLNSVSEHIAVIDRQSDIQFVNSRWMLFGRDNNCLMGEEWDGVNYLEVCDQSAAMGDESVLKAAEGIRQVINDGLESFYFEYPCHSPDEKRWFMMRVSPFRVQDTPYYVISHQNITERKLAEEALLSQARMDGLTNIPNRRYFDEFLSSEWRRCARLKMPLTLAILDIDHFKIFNDTYGHQEGDECLKRIGNVLQQFAKRPGDIGARFGGEEFGIVLGNTSFENSFALMNKILHTIRQLKIPNEKSPIKPIVTASIGFTSIYPGQQLSEKELIKAADSLLYLAKKKGRNQVACEQMFAVG